MDILMSETCWAHKKRNKIASDIKLVFHSSTITMLHGPINITYPNTVFQKQLPWTTTVTGAGCVVINPAVCSEFQFRVAQTQWNNNTPYLISNPKICLIRRPQCVSDDNTKTNLMHSVRMYGWLNWCRLRYSSGFMNIVMRSRLGYMKEGGFVDQFNKENSAPWNQYSRKRLREKQGKQMTPTCLTCCLNSLPLLFTSPHFIYSVANSTAVFTGPVDIPGEAHSGLTIL